MRRPTQKQLNWARWRGERHENMRAQKNLRILVTQPNYVIFRYLGDEVQFEYYENQVVMRGKDFPWMPPEDHAYLYSLADELMKAAFAGFRAAQIAKGQKIKTAASPATDLRQTSFRF